MKKIIFILAFLSMTSVAWAQGYNVHDIALSNIGGFAKPIGGAVITVCSGITVAVPCSPVGTIYTGENLSTSALNPFNADGNGNYSFWVLPCGDYSVSITGVGVTGYTYPIVIQPTYNSVCGFTNKSLVVTGGLNNVTLIKSQDNTSAIVGNNTDQTVYTYTIPANLIGPGSGLRVCFYSNHTTGSAAVTYKMILGSTTLFTHSNATAAKYNNYCADVFNKQGVQNAQTARIWLNIQGGTFPTDSITANNTATENLVNSLILKFTFNVANTDQVTGQGSSLEIIQ